MPKRGERPQARCTGECDPDTCEICTDPDRFEDWCEDCRQDAIGEAD